MPVQPTPETIKALQAIAEDLFQKTRAGRTTIRVDTTNDPDYPVLGEARAPGVSSLTGGMSLKGYKGYDIHKAPALVYLRDERKMIVQRDARVDPPVVRDLPEIAGVTGQMLTPVEREGRFVGIVSVHSVEPREWTEADVAAIKDATTRVERELERAIWFDRS